VLAHGALTNMATVIEGLEVNPEAMRRNCERAGVGSDPGEAEAMVARILAEGDA